MRRKRRTAGSSVFWLVMAGLAVCVLVLAGGCALFNQLPVARIVADPLTGASPLVVEFDASESTDSDGTIESYEWDFGDGESGEGETTHHTYVVTGATTTFTVTLTVVDDAGGSDGAVQSIEVQVGAGGTGGEGGPAAAFTVNRLIGGASLTVTFDASDSEAGTGTIIEYDWDFGDGAKGVGSSLSHTYTPDETTDFTVTLFVWNSEGDVDTAQKTITVIVPTEAADDDAPTADFDATDPLLLYASTAPTSTPTLYEVTFDPRGSFADAGHTIDYYVWDFGDGEEWVVETADAQITHVFKLAAPARTFVVRLFVYDDQGLEDIALLNLTLIQPED